LNFPRNLLQPITSRGAANMGPFMVEIVFCRVTRRGRKKKSGMNKLARENMRNDGPMQSFIPQDDMIKVTLDLSGKEVRENTAS
jgi:hypothetical protein